MKNEEELLMPLDSYLAAGVHIGTQQREASMKPFIYNVRPDGLSVFNVQVIDGKIRKVAKFLAKFKPESILVVSARESVRATVDKFAEMIGAKSISTRFMPGTLTNPDYDNYAEPDLLVVSDPALDYRAIAEATNVGIPVVALCDTNNTLRNIDLIIPGNNKGKKAVALILWLLAKEVLKKGEKEPKYTLEEMQE